MNEQLVATQLFCVNGLKAVVTRGGTGIGLMITQALVANGADVYITGRRKEALDTVVEKYSGKGGEKAGKIYAAPADITSKDDLQRLVKEIWDKGPDGIHLLVNNAGIAPEKETTKFSEDKEIDFTSAESFFTAAAFVPLLAIGGKKQKGYSSSIVNIASIAGILKNSSSGQFAYATSKAGFIHLTKMLGNYLSQTKIRVNCIAPGFFPSEMTAGSSNENQKSVLEGVGQRLPAHRSGDDADMVAAILYLAGPGGVYLNGQILVPDGGKQFTYTRKIIIHLRKLPGALLTSPSSM
ncbi:NAD(P)-binding protein [Choiromyces venosus 120613-1]|uniref:NAD(P)-binding protein n=1 Tax=Choiromyces venosus 120613-1 TaxID=1336337 RepID=A0A3N4JTE4_9PEZI|nr:NAD(P)-binding protein [Choiromyces venosus 120613-1]